MLRKKLSFIAVAVALLIVTALIIRRDTFGRSVSVTFLCYTNCDAQGRNDQYTWAWFEIENRTHSPVSCQLGPREFKQGSVWIQETNWVGYQYNPILEPGKTLIADTVIPKKGDEWRCGFLVTEMLLDEDLHRTLRYKLGRLLNHFGLTRGPWVGPKRMIITSDTVELTAGKNKSD